MSNLTLYAITDELMQQIDLLMATPDEELDDPESLKRFNELEQIRATKLSSCVGYLHSKQQRVDLIDTRIKQLQALKVSEEKKKENFKKYLLSQMNRLGRREIETEVGKLSIRETKATHIYDESILPEEYTTKKIVISPDKVKIKEAINSDIEVPGASIQINQSLQLK